MDNNYTEWLKQEIKKRGWKQADLSRRSGLATSVVSNLINGKRGPGEDTCRAIAHAFGYSYLTVMRAAGILDPIPPAEETFDEWLHVLRQLPQKDRDELLAFARLKLDLQHQAQPTPKTARDGQPRLELIKGKI